MNGYYVSGLVDGEGYFLVRPSIGRNKRIARGFNLRFGINMRKDDKPLLIELDNYFNNIGTWSERQDKHGLMPTTCYYIEGTIKGAKVIEHFDKYPLLGKKKEDYMYYKKITERILNKSHLKSMQEYLETVRLADEMRLNRVKEFIPTMGYSEALRRSSGSNKLYLEYVMERFPEYVDVAQDIVHSLLKDWE